MTIERTLIGIFGKMNAGKSTLMNLLTDQKTSIVDPTPGTTTDVKITLLELHQIGPIKLFDTPGVDETKSLGKKKYAAALSTLKEVDLALIVIRLGKNFPSLEEEKEMLSFLKKRKKQFLILYNLENNAHFSFDHLNHELMYEGPFLATNLSHNESKKQVKDFIETYCHRVSDSLSFYLPRIAKDRIVFLIIPMDAETPQKRLLRPQEQIQEHYLRHFVSTVCFRPDLQKARSHNLKEREEEYQRFSSSLKRLDIQKGKDLLITDSQALDVIHPWTLDKKGSPFIDITTFSILMINIKSKGRLKIFVEGLLAFSSLKKGDSILIAEVCNHNRIEEDIGTVQIPKKIEERFGKGVIHIDHAFGRTYDSQELQQYKLIIHCGACMIDSQKLQARIDDLIEKGCKITNYGLTLAYLQSENLLKRVLEPLSFDRCLSITER